MGASTHSSCILGGTAQRTGCSSVRFSATCRLVDVHFDSARTSCGVQGVSGVVPTYTYPDHCTISSVHLTVHSGRSSEPVLGVCGHALSNQLSHVFQRKKSAVSYLNSPLHQGTRKRGRYHTLHCSHHPTFTATTLTPLTALPPPDDLHTMNPHKLLMTRMDRLDGQLLLVRSKRSQGTGTRCPNSVCNSRRSRRTNDWEVH